MGLEIAPAPGVELLDAILLGSGTETSVDQLPHDITIDRSIAGLVPSDIRIRKNHLAKPLRWKVDDPSYEGTNWVVKNLLELKNARNVVIDDNLIENNWADDQNGFAILLTPRNQNGSSPWSTVENVQFTNNVVRHTTSAINILGWDNLRPSQQARNIAIKNNVFSDIGGARWGEDAPQTYGYGKGGWFLQMLDGTADVVVEHNTVLETKGLLVAGTAEPMGPHGGTPHTGFVFRHNIVRHGTMGVGPPASVSDYQALGEHFSSPTVSGNVLMGGPAVPYPSGNVRVATEDDVGFMDWVSGDLRLAATSRFKGGATDGADIGFDPVAFVSVGRAFTDATLTPGVHHIRAIHVAELRAAVTLLE